MRSPWRLKIAKQECEMSGQEPFSDATKLRNVGRYLPLALNPVRSLVFSFRAGLLFEDAARGLERQTWRSVAHGEERRAACAGARFFFSRGCGIAHVPLASLAF
jgi:hypothetical protein